MASIVILGDVINDILAKSNQELTQDSDTRATITVVPGGSAANTAAWLGAIGSDVNFVGKVGSQDAETHRQAFQKFGVKPYLAQSTEVATGSIVVVVDVAGNRTMFTDRGANLTLEADDVPMELLQPGSHLHLTGYTFFEPEIREVAVEVMKRAKAAGMTVSLDPSSIAFIREIGAEQFLEMVAGVDVFFPNIDEARDFTGVEDAWQSAEILNQHFPLVVITMDAKGAIIKRSGENAIHVPSQRVNVVDTTGAGDSYSAGFLHHWLAGDSLEDAGNKAAQLASIAVSKMGARPVAAFESKN